MEGLRVTFENGVLPPPCGAAGPWASATVDVKAARENLLAVIEPVLHGMDMLASEGSANCGEAPKQA